MTQFGATNQDEGAAATPSGKDFLEECRARLVESVAECVANYDGESVEEFADAIIDTHWDVEEADLKQSFKNGQSYRRSQRRSRRTR